MNELTKELMRALRKEDLVTAIGMDCTNKHELANEIYNAVSAEIECELCAMGKIASTLLDVALEEVDFLEIAENWLEDSQ